jgi:hypothetical protein
MKKSGTACFPERFNKKNNKNWNGVKEVKINNINNV